MVNEREQIEAALAGQHLHFWVRPHTADALVVQEVIQNPFYQAALSTIGKDAVVIDIGAHIGAFTILAALKGSRVLALEPVPANYDLLVDNLRLNCVQDRVEALNVAAWLSSGLRSMKVSDESTAGSSLCYGRDTETEISVQCVVLDDLIADRDVTTCDVLKLDCEGAEFEILEALRPETWRQLRAIVLEYHLFSAAERSTAQIVTPLLQNGFFVDEEAAETPGLGYVLAIQDNRTVRLPLLEPLGLELADSNLTRLPIVGPIWRVMRKPIHQLVVFYVNQLVARYNEHQQQAQICTRLIAQTQHWQDPDRPE
ncbi:MAG: FkbM family methyltransferase [Chloroflexi bacterium]|nr:FkbM family methyltransferase [Chloroflexota bacterium]